MNHGLPLVSPGEVGLSPERLARLDAHFTRYVDEGRLAGWQVVIARDGKVAHSSRCGLADREEGRPVADDTIWRIFSMTKPITAVAALMLWEEGRFELNDRVSKFIPEFGESKVWRGGTFVNPILEPQTEPMLMWHLFTHTAGLTYGFMYSHPVDEIYRRAGMEWGFPRDLDLAGVCSLLAKQPLLFQPGSEWNYSTSIDVLGRVVEVISGQRLGEFLRQRIFEPLGMTDTAFRVPEAQWHRIAEPFAHDPDGGVPYKVFDPRVAARLELGGGGLMSTTRDYARFLQMLLNRGELDGVRLLSPATVDFMTADHLGNIPIHGALLPPGHGFGLGFAVRRSAGEAAVPGSVGLYYWGGIAGTTFFVDPAQDLFAMLMIQAPNQRDHYRELFRNLVYATLTETHR